MKTSQFKILLGWILALTVINLGFLLLVDLRVHSIYNDVKNSGSGAISSQLTGIESQLSSQAANKSTVQPTTPTTTDTVSKTITCTGTLSQNLSGSATAIGSFTNYDLSGSSPIDLTCDTL
jgi:hypothetical protein